MGGAKRHRRRKRGGCVGVRKASLKFSAALSYFIIRWKATGQPERRRRWQLAHRQKSNDNVWERKDEVGGGKQKWVGMLEEGRPESLLSALLFRSSLICQRIFEEALQKCVTDFFSNVFLASISFEEKMPLTNKLLKPT